MLIRCVNMHVRIADVAFRLATIMEPLLKKEGLWHLFQNIEIPPDLRFGRDLMERDTSLETHVLKRDVLLG